MKFLASVAILASLAVQVPFRNSAITCLVSGGFLFLTQADRSTIASVRGRVFAITRGGDLKPGRLAHVYLFFVSKTAGHKVVESEDRTAALTFLEEHTHEMEKWSLDIRERGADLNLSSEALERISCKGELLAADHAILATLEWAQATHHSAQIASADADENGDFRFKNLRFGKYYLLARGRAGLNDVYWQQELWVESSDVLTVKLAQIESSCLDVE